MSTTAGDSVADRQRQRSDGRFRRNDATRQVEPPRQRRPALAALALLLIVGGALAAGLLALRMDSREAVLVAKEDIAPGTLISQDDLAEAQVASDKLETISVDLAPQVIGTYARSTIAANSLIEARDLSKEAPVGGDRAVVAVRLNGALTPASELQAGDLVRVVRVTGNSASSSSVRELTTALVMSISQSSDDGLGGMKSSTANLLVPDQVAAEVIDASAADLAGLALLERGQGTDVELEVAK